MANEMRILLATAGRSELLGRALKSLAGCRKPDIYRETVVVENGPPAGAREVVRAHNSTFFDIRHLHVPQANKSHALNVALRDMDDDCLVYFTDDDIQFEVDVLVRFANAAKGINAGHYFGGPFDVEYELPPPAWLIKYLPWSAQGWMPAESEVDLSDRYFLGFNWAAYVGDIRAAGMFDPTFGPGSASQSVGQESEMQIQLKKHGCAPHFVHDALVSHYIATARSTPAWAVKREYRNGIYGVLKKRHSHARLSTTALAETIKLSSRAVRLAWSRLSLDPETRFYHAARFSHTLGRLQGCRLGFSQHRADAVAQFDRPAEVHLDLKKAA